MGCLVKCLIVGGVLFALLTHATIAKEDWTQWGGAQRNFSVEGMALPQKIELKELWRRDLGEGYSSILVDAGKLYSMYRQGDNEIVICLDEKSGSTVWEHTYAAPMKKDAETSYGKGPNSTPIISGDAIVSIGFNGDLFCLDKNSGEVRWKLNLIGDLGGTKVDLGYSASPIIYEDRLLLPLGGSGHGIVALNAADGSIEWSAQDFKNSYSTPVLITIDGKDQMVFVMTDEVVSINPKDGKLFWKFPLENQWSCHAFSPVWDPDHNRLFVSSFRQSHGLQLKNDGESMTFEKSWSIPKTGVGFANAVMVGDIVVGSTGGSRSPLVTGFDMNTGEILWRERGFGVSNYVSASDRIILLDDKGNLAIAQPAKDGLNVLQKQQVLNAPKAWTAPTMVGNKLFLRDQKEIVSYELN